MPNRPLSLWLYVHVYVGIGVFSLKQRPDQGIRRITRPWMDVISSIPMTEMISNVNVGATVSDEAASVIVARLLLQHINL